MLEVPARGAWRCPYEACDGSGFVVDVETRLARECRCRPAMLAGRRVAHVRGRIAKRHQGLGFDRHPITEIAIKAPAVVKAVRGYCRSIGDRLDAGDGVWIYGDKGTGKTSLAMLIALEAVAARRTVGVYTVPGLLNAIRDTYNEGSGVRTAQLIEELSSVDLLVLDDLSVPRPTEWVLEQLYVLVNSRYEEERSIVATSDVGGGLDVEKDDAGELKVVTKPGEPLKPGMLVATERGAPVKAESADHTLVLGEMIGHRTVSRLVEMVGEMQLPLHGSDARYENDRF